MKTLLIVVLLHLLLAVINAQDERAKKCQDFLDEYTNMADGAMPTRQNYRRHLICDNIDFKASTEESDDVIECALDKSDCEDALGFCWDKGKCMFVSYKQYEASKKKQPRLDMSLDIVDGNLDLVTLETDQGNSGNEQTGSNNEGGDNALSRSFGFGPPPPTQICRPPPSFPHICGIRPPINRNLLDPPIDVPFCRRRPCGGKAGQGHPTICMSNPGCYFDINLYRLRLMYPRIYPGVPICYSVVNNPVFKKYADAFIQKFGKWRPVYTRCLINTYKQEMMMEQQRQGGCSMINSLEYLHFQPKLAGWGGMTQEECLLYTTSSCWHKHYGCIYACRSSSSQDVKVRAAKIASQERKIYTPGQIFGRQKCQVFPKGDQYYRFYHQPSDVFLTAYHRCLAAGCSLDPSAAYAYYYHFRNISMQVDHYYRQHFWNNVYKGSCNANNYATFLDFYNGLPSPQPVDPFYGGIGGAIPFSLERSLDSSALNGGVDGDTGGSETTVGNERTFNFGQPQQFYRPPRCPYIAPKIQLPNIHISEYSMRTCCDRPACFHDNLFDSTDLYTGVTSYYGPSRLGPCSKTCGGGVRQRNRPCITINGMPCEGDIGGSVKCNTHKCPKYANWGRWEDCSAKCGTGSQRRRRSCISVNGAPCENIDGYGGTMTRNCNTGSCPTIDRNVPWGPCVIPGNDPNCGSGKRIKVYRCTDGGYYGCPDPAEKEIQTCNKYCGKWERQGGRCINCYQTTTYNCELRDGSPGHCDPSKKPRSESRYCCGGFNYNYGGGGFNFNAYG